jgi:hypothetical protein
MYIIFLIKICVGYTVFMCNTVWDLLSSVPASRMLQKLTEQINWKLAPAHFFHSTFYTTITNRYHLRESFYDSHMYFCCTFTPFLLRTPKQYIKKPLGRPSDVIGANRRCVSLSKKEEVEELKHLDKGTYLKSLCEKYDGLSTICYLKKQRNCWNCTVIVMNKCQLGKQSMFLWAK